MMSSFSPQKTNDLYLVIALILQTTVTTPTFSAFPGDHLYSILVNLPAKNI